MHLNILLVGYHLVTVKLHVMVKLTNLIWAAVLHNFSAQVTAFYGSNILNREIICKPQGHLKHPSPQEKKNNYAVGTFRKNFHAFAERQLFVQTSSTMLMKKEKNTKS